MQNLINCLWCLKQLIWLHFHLQTRCKAPSPRTSFPVWTELFCQTRADPKRAARHRLQRLVTVLSEIVSCWLFDKIMNNNLWLLLNLGDRLLMTAGQATTDLESWIISALSLYFQTLWGLSYPQHKARCNCFCPESLSIHFFTRTLAYAHSRKAKVYFTLYARDSVQCVECTFCHQNNTRVLYEHPCTSTFCNRAQYAQVTHAHWTLLQ